MSNYIDNYQTKKTLISKPPLEVATPATLEKLGTTLAGERIVSVDTESDSLYSYFEKVCLVQFSTRDEDYLVDPLALNGSGADALSPLGPIFADPGIEKVFHAAEYDILCLKRDWQFKFENLFDTMIAARILGWKNVGLGSILQEQFGLVLNKKMQRTDWGRRPLSSEQLSYAREDTHYLLQLYDLQVRALEQAGRLDEAREEFVRLTRVEPSPRRFDPEGYWNLAGARELEAASLGVLRELYRFRDAQARKENRPPFKILSDAMLLHVAQALPKSPHALQRMGAISDYVAKRYGASLLSSVSRGIHEPQVSIPRPHARKEPPMDNATRLRMSRLKEWRKTRADRRGVESDVIVSNDVLIALARENPRTVEALVEVSGLGPWKAREYGEELLTALHGKRQ